MAFKDHRQEARNAETLQAFNVYRTASLADLLDHPRTHAFVDGIAVRSQVSVVTADPGGVVLQVHPNQVPALERAHTVLLESPLHGATFRTAVDDVDRARGYVSVSRLEPCPGHHEKRAIARTVPGLSTVARVQHAEREVSGRVVDLSPSALAADFDHDGFLRIAAAEKVRLEVSAEPEESCPLDDFVTEARIHRTTQHEEEGRALCRAVLVFETYPALDRVLRQYVARRQLHLLTELLGTGH